MRQRRSATVLDSLQHQTDTRRQGALQSLPGRDCIAISVGQAKLEMCAYQPDPRHKSVATNVNCEDGRPNSLAQRG